MDSREFRSHAHEMVDWLADFLDNIEKYPVMSPVKPGGISNQLPLEPPEAAESFPAIFADFERIILPGITHWQHPSFFAYFPANSSYPSLLGEMLTAALGAQCMSWQTSPAATELEERVMQWTRKMIGLPESFQGVIQDTASTATLCSLLSARERISNFGSNEVGISGDKPLRVYCSQEAHSSVEKAVKIAGFGRQNLVKIAVDDDFALRADGLKKAIVLDQKAGSRPLAVVATFGTTGSTAVDPLADIAAICREHGLWLHVDAAYAGTALVLPEYRQLLRGIEEADSFVFNPHKWMFTNFDCSAYFVRDPELLQRTFAILPEYLKTREDSQVHNYRDWGIQLGRRFRALKLWFVIRSFGVRGIRVLVAAHIRWAKDLARRVGESADFELLAPVPFGAVCFRYHPQGVDDDKLLDELNIRLLEKMNDSGKLFLTHTRLKGRFTIRLVVGQTRVQESHVLAAWLLIQQTARALRP